MKPNKVGISGYPYKNAYAYVLFGGPYLHPLLPKPCHAWIAVANAPGSSSRIVWLKGSFSTMASCSF